MGVWAFWQSKPGLTARQTPPRERSTNNIREHLRKDGFILIFLSWDLIFCASGSGLLLCELSLNCSFAFFRMTGRSPADREVSQPVCEGSVAYFPYPTYPYPRFPPQDIPTHSNKSTMRDALRLSQINSPRCSLVDNGSSWVNFQPLSERHACAIISRSSPCITDC